MADKNNACYSGIGGQAVLEGIMMKNKENRVGKGEGNEVTASVRSSFGKTCK